MSNDDGGQCAARQALMFSATKKTAEYVLYYTKFIHYYGVKAQ